MIATRERCSRRSEVVELLIGVDVGSLKEHLLRLLGQLVLLVHLNAILQSFNITLLRTKMTLLNLLLFSLVSSLEVHLGLQIAS